MAGLRTFAADKPVHGECGGYMTLGQGLVDASGVCHAMAGLLDIETSFASRKMTLGYRRVRLLADSPLGVAGAWLRGHEFHYATLARAGDNGALCEAEDAGGVALGPSGSRRGRVTGSFFHVIDQG
jgi:cobyrinic acid a,c-diamide synthase